MHSLSNIVRPTRYQLPGLFRTNKVPIRQPLRRPINHDTFTASVTFPKPPIWHSQRPMIPLESLPLPKKDNTHAFLRREYEKHISKCLTLKSSACDENSPEYHIVSSPLYLQSDSSIYDDLYGKLHRHIAVRMLPAIEDFFKANPGESLTIMDLGCGDGKFFEYLLTLLKQPQQCFNDPSIQGTINLVGVDGNEFNTHVASYRFERALNDYSSQRLSLNVTCEVMTENLGHSHIKETVFDEKQPNIIMSCGCLGAGMSTTHHQALMDSLLEYSKSSNSELLLIMTGQNPMYDGYGTPCEAGTRYTTSLLQEAGFNVASNKLSEKVFPDKDIPAIFGKKVLFHAHRTFITALKPPKFMFSFPLSIPMITPAPIHMDTHA